MNFFLRVILLDLPGQQEERHLLIAVPNSSFFAVPCDSPSVDYPGPKRGFEKRWGVSGMESTSLGGTQCLERDRPLHWKDYLYFGLTKKIKKDSPNELLSLSLSLSLSFSLSLSPFSLSQGCCAECRLVFLEHRPFLNPLPIITAASLGFQ